MINKILSIFKEKNIKKFSIRREKMTSRELFFIKKDLSMARSVTETSYILTIFKEFKNDEKNMLGQSNVIVSSNMSDAELSKIIEDAYESAGYVNNEFYKTPEHIRGIDLADSFDNKSLSECANIMAEALFKNDTNKDVFINSAEIFARRYSVHIISSDDVIVDYISCIVSGEYVCQKKEPIDVETHTQFAYKTLDINNLANKVKESLNNTRLRSIANYQLHSGNYNVMLTGSYVYDFFSYFTDKAYANTIVSKISDYTLGCNIQGDNIVNDRLNMNLEPIESYSFEGINMITRPFIEDGILKTIHGDSESCYKLGIKPIGCYSGISVKPGSDNNTPKQYLEAIIFSDFQVDISSGFFGGELRLGIWHDGDVSFPVSGCIINGNVSQVVNNIKLSKETQAFLGYNGPKHITFENISVTGNL